MYHTKLTTGIGWRQGISKAGAASFRGMEVLGGHRRTYLGGDGRNPLVRRRTLAANYLR